MAQNYGVDIQRWNGQDYDTILPTPDAHASTHQANGSDPLILQTGNYGDKTVTSDKLGDTAVTTSKIANNAVTRDKLANDALYSPYATLTEAKTISSSDIGQTLVANVSSKDYVINFVRDVNIPRGAEVAIFRQWAKTINIVFGPDAALAIAGASNFVTAPTLTIDKFTMVAFKKLATDSSKDYWLLTGDAEVVS